MVAWAPGASVRSRLVRFPEWCAAPAREYDRAARVFTHGHGWHARRVRTRDRRREGFRFAAAQSGLRARSAFCCVLAFVDTACETHLDSRQPVAGRGIPDGSSPGPGAEVVRDGAWRRRQILWTQC